jgi:DNA polymerase-3 subunit delta'
MADTEAVPRFDAIDGWPLPEERGDWFGDRQAETALLDAYRSGRMHHAWLIGGQRGIGKATLAVRFARFVLANPDPRSPAVVRADDLSVPADSRAFRLVARRVHAGLLVLDRPYDDKTGRYRTELTVGEIRRTVSFFGATAGEGGWRIAIVDPADDMNASAANALLKVLEEPPARSLFLIVTHAPGRLMPTIRSRCRRLDLQPLSDAAIGAAIRANRPDEEPADLAVATRLAEGSLRRAILLVEGGGIELYRNLSRVLDGLPAVDVGAMHGLAEQAAERGNDGQAFDTFIELLRDWLARRVRREGEPGEGGGVPLGTAGVPLERWAEVWEKVNQSSALAEALNLDRKQAALSILMTLARATRM